MKKWSFSAVVLFMFAGQTLWADLPADIRVPQDWYLTDTHDIDLLGSTYRIRMYYSKSLVDERDKGNVFLVPVITELDGGVEKLVESGADDLYSALNYYAAVHYNPSSCYQFFRDGDAWMSDCEAWVAYYDNTLYDTEAAVLATGIQVSKTAIGMLLTAGASSPAVLVEWTSNLYDRFNSIYGSLAADRLHAAAAALAFADPAAYENATGEFGETVWAGVEKYYSPEYKARISYAYGASGDIEKGIKFVEQVEAYHWLKVNGFGELSGGAGKVLASGGALIGDLAVGQLATMATDAEALHQESLRVQNFHALALWHVCNQGANASLRLPYCTTPSQLMEQCMQLKYLNWHRLRTLQMLSVNMLDYNQMLLGDSWVKWLGDEKKILGQLEDNLEVTEGLFSSFQKDVRSVMHSCQVADDYFAVIYPAAVTLETPQVIEVENNSGVLRVEPGSLSFGIIPSGGVATIPLVAFNSGGISGFSWQVQGLDSGPFSIVGATSGIISSNEGLELLVRYDGVSEGSLSDSLLLTAVFGDGTEQTSAINISANAVDAENFTALDRPIELARGILGSVQDGTYLSRQYSSGAWEDLGWQGGTNRLRTMGYTDNTVATSIVKFDLPAGLEDTTIISAELCLRCASVEQSGKVVLYEHGYSFTEASCVFAEYRTDSQYLDMSIVSSPREVTFSGSRLRDLVQKWVADPDSNNGFLMLAPDYADLSFYSSEDSTLAYRPSLKIEYQHSDNRKPSLSIHTPRSGWMQAGPCTVSGHAFDFHGIDKVTVNGGKASLSSVDDRTCSFSKVIQLRPGRNEIAVVAEDGSLEENERNKSVTVCTPDVALVLDDYNLQLSQGESADVQITCKAMYGFDSQVMLNFDSSPLDLTLDETEVSVGGSAMLNLHAGEDLAPGEYQVLLRAQGGGVEQVAEITVLVSDGKAPELLISTPSEGVITTESTWTVAGSARDVGSSGLADVSCAALRPVGELTNQGTLGSWKFYVPLEGGQNVFYIIAKDNAGNATRLRCNVIKASGPVSAPVVTNLVDGAVGVAVVGTTLEWDRVPGADEYRIYISTVSSDVAFGGAAIDGAIELVTSRPRAELPVLTSGLTYYYRIDAVNDYGVMSSAVRSFSTLGDEIVAEWRFENISNGICKDRTGAGNDLTVSEATNVVSGLLGDGLHFSATGHHARVVNIPYESKAALGFWFKGCSSSTNSSDWAPLANVRGVPLEINSENRLRVRVGYGEWITEPCSKGTWNCVIFSINQPGNGMRISVFSDNEWSHTFCSSTIPLLTGEVTLGSDVAGAAHFMGTIDEISLLSIPVAEADCGDFIARVQQSATFSYTFSIMAKSNELIPDAELILDQAQYYSTTNGVIRLELNPRISSVDAVADHYTFSEKTLNLRWADENIMVLPADSRPFGCSVDVPGYASLGDPVSITTHAFDFEAGEDEYFVEPYKVRVGTNGEVYILDRKQSRLYRTIDGNTLQVVAGTGVAGYNGDGIPAIEADLNGPWGFCLDDTGNIYIADRGNHRIRKVDPGGIISTFAGTGVASKDESTVSGTATLCEINSPQMVEFIDGYVYLDDWDREAILRVNSSGTISLYAQPADYAIAPKSSIGMGDILALVKDTNGAMLALEENDMILKLNGGSSYSIYSGNYHFDHMGDGADVGRGGFNEATDLVIGSGYMAANTKLVADHGVRRLRYVDGNKWYTFAGNGGLGFPIYGRDARTCALRVPVSCDSDGSNIYIADEGNYSIFKVDASGVMRPFFESGCVPSAGILEYQVDYGDGTLSEWSTTMVYEHVYVQAGAYELRARSKDAGGQVSEWSAAASTRIYDEGASAKVTTYTDEVVNLSEVPSGESVVARRCSVLSAGQFSIGSGAKLILDNSSLYLPEGSDVAIGFGGELLTMPGSVITADNISSDLDGSETWWTDTDDARVEFNGSRINCRSMNLDVTSYIQRETDIMVQGANGVYPDSKNGDEASFIIRSVEGIQILNDSSFELEGGAGANASADDANGGVGGGMRLELLSKADIILDNAIDIRGEGGAGGVSTSSREPGHSGNGGDATVNIQADGDVPIQQCELDIEGGGGFDGSSSYKESARNGGGAGSAGLYISSVSGTVECVNFYYEGSAGDSGDGGYDRKAYYSGGNGGAGASSTVHISAAKDIVIKGSKLTASTGDGGNGGDGDNGDRTGMGGIGGTLVVQMISEEQLIMTNSYFAFYSGDGGHGGQGADGNGSSGQGGYPGIGGESICDLKTDTLSIFDTRFKVRTGQGGDAGVPYSTSGFSGASGGGINWFWEADELTFLRSDIDIEAGDGGAGAVGNRDSGSGGSGGACDVNLAISSSVDLLGSSIDLDAGDGGKAASSGHYNSPRGGLGGNVSFMMTNTVGRLDIVSSSLTFNAGDGEDGGGADTDPGGGGGAGGSSEVFFRADQVSFIQTDTLLRVVGGDGGNGGPSYGDGSNEGGGAAGLGGEGFIEIHALGQVSSSKARIEIEGGSGGKGGRAGEDEDSVDSVGANGGPAFMRVESGSCVADASIISIIGGVGGRGRSNDAGDGGDALLTVDSTNSIFTSTRLDVVGGLPSQNDAGVYSAKGAESVDIQGEAFVSEGYLNQDVRFAAGADVRKTLMRSFSEVDSSRGADLRDAGISIYDFVSLNYAIPRPFGESWTLTYRAAESNWVVSSSIIGSLAERVSFGETFESPELGVVFSLGTNGWFAWSEGDSISFSVEQPNLATTSETADLDAVKQIAIQTADGIAYKGQVTVYGYVGQEEHSSWEFLEPPYCISLPGWTVGSNEYTSVSGSDYRIRLQAPGSCLELTTFVMIAGVPTYTLTADSDSDGLSDLTEQTLGTLSCSDDSDGDGLLDWEEYYLDQYAGADATKGDSDGDGVNDGDEFEDGTNIGDPLNYGDRPPMFAFVGLDPDNPRASDGISARWVVSDPDFDPINVEYRWVYNDDTIVESGILTNIEAQPGINTLSLTSSVQRDDVIRFELVAYSGSPVRWSSWTNTESVVIANSPPDPTIPSVMSVAPGEISELELSATDADGDSLIWSLSPPVLALQYNSMMEPLAETANDSGIDYGEVEINADVVTYTSGLGFYTQDVFSVYCSDGIDVKQHDVQVLVAHTDSDGDGINDYEELYVHGTDPDNSDSDGDAVDDGQELSLGLNPNKADTDDDGLADGEEVNTYGTNPLDSDSDDDGLSDGDEVRIHNTDPLESTEFTLIFDSAGGAPVNEIRQSYNTAVIAPADPSRIGYSFSGWSPTVPTTMPSTNQTLIAQWMINQSTLSFESDGGTTVDPITQDYGTAITPPSDPTRIGNSFIGWVPEVPEIMLASNLTVTAQWSINQYTLSFDSVEGSSVNPITQDYGTVVTPPANPTRTGYTFTGWNPAIPPTMPATNLTVTAQWEAIPETTYALSVENGTGDGSYTNGAEVNIEVDTAPNGQVFDGWSVIPAEYAGNIADTNAAVTSFIMPENNVTITAHYSTQQSTYLFEEAFENLDQWTLWGSPSPLLNTANGYPAPSFNNNGDGSYDSGAISKQNFDFSKGLVVEADAYQDRFGYWQSFVIGLAKRASYGSFDGAAMSVGIRARHDNGDKTQCYVAYSATETEVFELNDPSTDWRHYRFVIRDDQHVEFYKDDTLLYTSTNQLDMAFNNMPIVLGSRARYSPVLIDNIKISSYESEPDVVRIRDYEVMASGEFMIQWASEPNRYYSVYRSLDLLDDFRLLKPNIEHPQNSYTDTVSRVMSQLFYKVKVTEEPVSNDIPNDMVIIPIGTNSGTDSIYGPYSLSITNDMCMDAYEVSGALWSEVYDWAVVNGYDFSTNGVWASPEHPVVWVNWFDCAKWCNARSEMLGRDPCYFNSGILFKSGEVENVETDYNANGFRMPTQVEWEYAARGGYEGYIYPWGNQISSTNANYTMTTTTSCGSYAATGFGLYDIVGNVHEWCDNETAQGIRGRSSGGYGSSEEYLRCGFSRDEPAQGLEGNAWKSLGFRTICYP
ncbi:InlB B-repeat-containing protein [Pontiellaceae bacterium B12227]|nr:InlB B-repeat-containing protein [Pontiellaceae bacterium B12227]